MTVFFSFQELLNSVKEAIPEFSSNDSVAKALNQMVDRNELEHDPVKGYHLCRKKR